LILYIPFTEGYFANSLEIFEYQVDSLRAATGEPFDLLVFDNASCAPVVSALKGMHEQKKIDWLILSGHNMGKAGAWNWIFSAMPNELICYADSDVLFRPGWLEASLQVLEAFPQAGMVGAQPGFYDVLKGEGKAHLAVLEDLRYSAIDYRPPAEVVDEYVFSIGASDEVASQFYDTPLPALVHKETGVQAVIGASHMQFMIPRQVARQVTPLPATHGLLRAETTSLDRKIDQLGYLHLSTIRPYVFHMGNTLNDRLLGEVQAVIGAGAERAGSGSAARRAPSGSALQRGLAALARHPRSQKLLVRLYNLLFRALYAETIEK
jgi:hypothetical protein